MFDNVMLEITRRMAIANGTCVSFCNQPIAQFGYLRRVTPSSVLRVGGGIWLPQESLRHILASPGYAPWTIAVNVTWMKRGFNAGQTHRSIYPSVFNRLRAIARYWSEIATFSYPLHLTPPFGCFHWNSWKKFGTQKTRIMGLPGSEDSSTILYRLNRFDTIPACDRQTDRQTDSRPMYSYNVCSMTDAR